MRYRFHIRLGAIKLASSAQGSYLDALHLRPPFLGT